MTEQEKRDLYKEANEKLLKDITGIMRIYEGQPKSFISSKIMARLREEHIFVRNSYIAKFENKRTGDPVTIDPFADEVKPALEEGDEEGRRDDQYCRVYAYSFGPWNPEKYFNDNSFTIVWLLKEPFVQERELQNYRNGVRSDLGGHNQAEEYYEDITWEELISKYDGNPTIAKVIKLTNIILKQLGIDYGEFTKGNDNENDLIMRQVMNHICILEVNHFPGLGFKSTKSDKNLIGKWAEENNELIEKLIEFYSPKLLIGGNTLRHFYDSKKSDSIEILRDNLNNGLLTKLGIKVIDLYNPEDSPDYVMKAEFVNGKKPVYVIDAYHPSYSAYTPTVAELDGKMIAKFINSNDSKDIKSSGE